MNANDILGNYDTRYFGAGHKHTTYAMTDVKKNTKGKQGSSLSTNYRKISRTDLKRKNQINDQVLIKGETND